MITDEGFTAIAEHAVLKAGHSTRIDTRKREKMRCCVGYTADDVSKVESKHVHLFRTHFHCRMPDYFPVCRRSSHIGIQVL